MNKPILLFIALIMSPVLIPAQLMAQSEIVTTTVPIANPTEAAQANELISRLNEIMALDKSKLSSTEKREMRKEVRSIQTMLKTLGDGVYISLGAILIIIILLIILL